MKTIDDYINNNTLKYQNFETLKNPELFNISEAKIFFTNTQSLLLIRINDDFRTYIKRTKNGCKKYFTYYYGNNGKWL